MKLPFLVLSYGDFATTKKLFICEKAGELILPIFYDNTAARAYQLAMEERLRELGDERTLMPQLCVDKTKALDMLTILSTMLTGLDTIGLDMVYDDDDGNLYISIADFIEKLRDYDAGFVSNTENSESSS